ncbi:CHAT domain-containing protein [Ideonella sp. DXS29W]|uniref:CHAT domain-containing protein n=1 Tax=Ideonella lacteola TaxID=2984193 RepID=A0ABU9BNQ5_9BURK
MTGEATLADGAAPHPALVEQWLDEGLATPPMLDVATAWALKDACYAAWNTEPRRAAQAAQLLAVGAAALPADTAADDRREIGALAAWTGGIAAITRGQMAEAVAAFDAAAEALGALGQPGPAAQTQVPKIMALAMLGRNAEAVACAESTQAAFVAQGDVRAASKVSLNLGSLHLRHDEYGRAAVHYRDAVRLFARVGDREHSVMADIGLADALTALGDLDEAERIYARARVRAAAHALPVLQAMVDESMAILDLSRGRFGEALAGFERSRAGYERLDMPQHLAIAEKQLADAYLELHLLPEADALFGLALQKFEALDMPNDLAWTLAQQGRAWALLGRSEEAAARFDAALALFTAQDNQTGRAAVMLARAELALATTDTGGALRALRALEWAGAAKQAYQTSVSGDGAMRAALVHAQSLALTQQPEAARDAFSAALTQAREGRRLAAEVRALAGLAAARQALGEHLQAREGFLAAVALFEELRQALPGDDVRSAFLADHLQPYRELLRYALQDHEAHPTPAQATEVLRAADRFRARTLSERLAGGRERTRDDDDTAAALRARVSWLARRAHGLEDDDDTPSATLLDELHDSEQRLLEHVRRQRLTSDVAGTLSTPAPSPPAQVGEDEALVEYVVLEDELLACVLQHGEVTVHRRLARWGDVTQAVQAVQFQLDALAHGAQAIGAHLATLTRRCEARLGQLHALVWARLNDALPGARRVLLVAPAPLSSVPFSALVAAANPPGTPPPVEFAWAPSAASMQARRMGDRLPPKPRMLVLGESSRLPHAAVEARTVAAIFDGAALRLDAEARVSVLTDEASRADLLHLACHAQFRADSPGFSALHLHDGALTAEQVETLSLRATVVVLSACETAGRDSVSGTRRGDEWVGLVRAFLLAGAGRVVASLWPVDDQVTCSFMALFYRALAAGQTAGEALRTAQQALRQQHPHPFHWAAFALYGGF